MGWGVEAAERIRRRQSNQEEFEELEAQSRRLLEERGSILWSLVCEAVADFACDLNRVYGSTLIRPKARGSVRLDLEFEYGERLTGVKIEFEPTTSHAALRWEYCGYLGKGVKHGSCHLYIRGSGEAAFRRGLQFLRPVDLAEEILNGLIAE